MVSENSLFSASSNHSPKFSNSFTTRIFSDVAGDITIVVDGESFILHKFPLVSRSGKIRKLAAEAKDSNPAKIELIKLPGGPQSFELAMKFCYGINFEITPANVAALRCTAEYLEMTEDYLGDGSRENNLVGRTEAYLSQVVVQSLENSIRVLSSCEALAARAVEEAGIAQRCIEAVAGNALREEQLGGEWWIEDLSTLRIDFFERVVIEMGRVGVKQSSVAALLMHYAQVSLKGEAEKCPEEERSIVEVLTGLIPSSGGWVPLSFLFGMLKIAAVSEAEEGCRAELERRIAVRFEEVLLDDLLIPSSRAGESMFDVDVVRRMLVGFLQRVEEDEEEDDGDDESGYYESAEGVGSSSHAALLKVGRLMDAYLAEIAPDPYLCLPKFIALVELLPDYARVIDDGLYRAVDIYLKAHPMLTELESKKLCKLIDCGKLSQEACNHAAQNERLPVQMSVKVLYFEQLRLRNSLSGSLDGGPLLSQRLTGSGVASAAMSPRDNYASLRRENRELKLEISRMRVRLSELEKEQVCMRQGMVDKGGSGRALLTSISRGIGRMGIFGGSGPSTGGRRQKPGRKPKSAPTEGKNGRSRRHSVS